MKTNTIGYDNKQMRFIVDCSGFSVSGYVLFVGSICFSGLGSVRPALALTSN